MRKPMIVLAALLATAQVGAQVRTSRVVLAKYDLDSATYVYCLLSAPRSEQYRIETSGSSATVTGVGTGTPFTDIAVGDEITAQSINLAAPVTFTVIARASATSITADRNINLDVDNGAILQWRDLACGDTAADGWFEVPAGDNHIFIVYTQGDLTGGVDVVIEARTRGTYLAADQIITFTLAAPGDKEELALVEKASEWRIGLKYNTADPGDAAANIEQINVILWSER